MSATGLIDLGYDGNRFTWTNKREGMKNIKERLDRGSLQIIAHCSSTQKALRISGTRFSVFEEMWLRDPTCRQVIKDARSSTCHHGSAMSQLQHKISNTRRVLRGWNWEAFGCLSTRIKRLNEELETLRKKEATFPGESPS